VSRRAQRRLIVATVILVVVFAVAMVYVVTRQGAYYRQVSALTAADNGRNVKVGGGVLRGTIVRDAAGAHFTIEDLTGRPTTVRVDYAGQMPATFAAGVQVVVTGKYASGGGVIAAAQLETKCPSKYVGKASPLPQPSSTE
jgi:cytochrome c-type biogenesis protein CcmE